MRKYQILSLDCVMPQLPEALQTIAPEGFEITTIDSPSSCIMHAQTSPVDLALVRLMADTDQMKNLCKKLSKNKQKTVPVIAFTDTDDIAETVRGFESGAFDVFSPLCPHEQLEKRLKVALSWGDKEEKLSSKLKQAKETAFCAMEDANDLGYIITFLNESTNCTGYSELAEHCFSTLKAFNVSGSLVFHSKNSDLYFSDDQREKPIELKLLNALHHSHAKGNNICGRFKTFSKRIMVTSNTCSLLVRNAPDDPIKLGQLRDILGALINGLDTRAFTIEATLTSARNTEVSQELFDVIRNAMIELGALFSEHEHETISIMDDLMHHTQEGMSLLGLTEEQEEYFVNSIESSMSRLVSLYTKGVQFDGHFQNILQLLTKLSAQL